MRRLVVFAAALTLAACASTKAPPLTEVGPGFDKGETAILHQAEEAEAELRRRGMLFDDPELAR